MKKAMKAMRATKAMNAKKRKYMEWLKQNAMKNPACYDLPDLNQSNAELRLIWKAMKAKEDESSESDESHERQ